MIEQENEVGTIDPYAMRRWPRKTVLGICRRIDDTTDTFMGILKVLSPFAIALQYAASPLPYGKEAAGIGFLYMAAVGLAHVYARNNKSDPVERTYHRPGLESVEEVTGQR